MVDASKVISKLASAAEQAMKTALHKGTASDLNIYTANIKGSVGGNNIAGWSTFPSDYAAQPTMDGVVMLLIFPDDTLTHEVGQFRPANEFKR